MIIDWDADRKGWICVRLDPSEDAEWTLAGEGWEKHFDLVEIRYRTFEELDLLGFWSAFDKRVGVDVDWMEEEWIQPDRLDVAADFIREFKKARPDLPSAALLDGILKLIETAKSKNLPVIFAF